MRRLSLSDAVRMRIGLFLMVGFALVSDARWLGRALHHRRALARPDEVTQQESRFGRLQPLLPPHSAVGYVTDRAPQGRPHDDDFPRLAFKRYLLTQYALLPAIVLPGIHGALVVGDFYSSPGSDSDATRGLTLIRDFGGGVMLFRTSSE